MAPGWHNRQSRQGYNFSHSDCRPPRVFICGQGIHDLEFRWHLSVDRLVPKVKSQSSLGWGIRLGYPYAYQHELQLVTVSATIHSPIPLTAWLPLQNAAGAFRDECSSLEQTVQELFADLDRLSGELETKADELEDGRRRLSERGRQLAEQRKESARLSHQLEQQETQLSETLSELRELRAELAGRPEPVPGPDLRPELESLRSQLTELQVERAVLLERLESASKQVPVHDTAAPQILSEGSLQILSEQFAEQLAELQQQIQTSQPGPSTSLDLTELKQSLIDQHQIQLTSALAELGNTQAERLSKQLTEIQQQIEAAQPSSTAAAEVAEIKQSLLEQHEAQLAKALAEFRDLRAELTSRTDAPPAQEYESAALRQQISELEVERAILRERLEVESRQSPSDDALALSKETIESLSDQFTALQSDIQALQQDRPDIAELEALKIERLELESELELVRARSTALQETVSLQKQELASQRASVTEELQELRGLLAEQTRLLTEREPASPAPPATKAQPRTERESSPEVIQDDSSSKHLDPVVNSVMAQFAKLQKDIAQRRKKK